MGNNVNGLGIGKSDLWQTPKHIFDALGVTFDLDVAAPVDGPLHVPALSWISEGSLETDWSGFVWMNPPFGGRNALQPWLKKFLEHGNGIALTPDRTSAPWFQFALSKCDAVLFTKGKPRFIRPDGNDGGCPAFGCALWASGERAKAALLNAQSAGLGVVLEVRK